MDVNKQFAQMFRSDPNISKAFRDAVAPRDAFADALDAANTKRLADIRELIKDERPAMMKLIELYGAECIVAGQMMARRSDG
jgi:hypothetical protein